MNGGTKAVGGADTVRSLGLLVLRVGVAGLLLSGHGWSKLMHFSQRAATFSDPIGLGPQLGFTLVVFAEVFCSAGIILGLCTRLATIPQIIFFCVAAFVQHGHDPWSKRELPMLFLVPVVTLLITGAGRYSLDALISAWWRGRRRASASPERRASVS
ncbi:MAG: DoxX family protein [Hyphomicrobiales bacterium]